MVILIYIYDILLYSCCVLNRSAAIWYSSLFDRHMHTLHSWLFNFDSQYKYLEISFLAQPSLLKRFRWRLWKRIRLLNSTDVDSSAATQRIQGGMSSINQSNRCRSLFKYSSHVRIFFIELFRINLWCRIVLNVKNVYSVTMRSFQPIDAETKWPPFSWMKIFEFRLPFHWSWFLRFQLTIFQHRFR